MKWDGQIKVGWRVLRGGCSGGTYCSGTGDKMQWKVCRTLGTSLIHPRNVFPSQFHTFNIMGRVKDFAIPLVRSMNLTCIDVPRLNFFAPLSLAA